MMHRNLDRRVEVLVRLPSEHTGRAASPAVLDLAFDEGTSAWELLADGTWDRAACPPTRHRCGDLQDTLTARHRRR